jgi:hypothetical protein
MPFDHASAAILPRLPPRIAVNTGDGQVGAQRGQAPSRQPLPACRKCYAGPRCRYIHDHPERRKNYSGC